MNFSLCACAGPTSRASIERGALEWSVAIMDDLRRLLRRNRLLRHLPKDTWARQGHLALPEPIQNKVRGCGIASLGHPHLRRGGLGCHSGGRWHLLERFASFNDHCLKRTVIEKSEHNVGFRTFQEQINTYWKSVIDASLAMISS